MNGWKQYLDEVAKEFRLNKSDISKQMGYHWDRLYRIKKLHKRTLFAVIGWQVHSFGRHLPLPADIHLHLIQDKR